MLNKFRYVLRNKFNRNIDSTDITMAQLKQIQKNGAIIIDVRSPLEYKEGHIGGAISIPEYEIRNRITECLKDKNEQVVLYCQSGYRSKKAQRELNKMGYKNVLNLYNGIENY